METGGLQVKCIYIFVFDFSWLCAELTAWRPKPFHLGGFQGSHTEPDCFHFWEGMLSLCPLYSPGLADDAQ